MRTSLCARDKYSSRSERHRVRSGKKTEAIETNSVASMEIFSAVSPLTSGTRSTFRGCWGTVTQQHVLLPGSHGEGSTAGGDVPPQLPAPMHSVPGRCFHWLGKAFCFFLKFTPQYSHRALQIFIILPFCTLLRINYILQSSLFLCEGRSWGLVLLLLSDLLTSVAWSWVPDGVFVAKLPTGTLRGRRVVVSCVTRHPDIVALLLTCAR